MESIDPATGLKTTYDFTDEYTDDVTDHEQAGSTNQHQSGASTTNPDIINGSDDITAHKELHDHTHTIISVSGTDTNGNTANLTQIEDTVEGAADDITDDVGETADGTLTVSDDVKDTVDTNTTLTLQGMSSLTDPVTGVTTIVRLNEKLTEILHDFTDNGDTKATPRTGTVTDTPTHTEMARSRNAWRIMIRSLKRTQMARQRPRPYPSTVTGATRRPPRTAR